MARQQRLTCKRLAALAARGRDRLQVFTQRFHLLLGFVGGDGQGSGAGAGRGPRRSPGAPASDERGDHLVHVELGANAVLGLEAGWSECTTQLLLESLVVGLFGGRDRHADRLPQRA